MWAMHSSSCLEVYTRKFKRVKYGLEKKAAAAGLLGDPNGLCPITQVVKIPSSSTTKKSCNFIAENLKAALGSFSHTRY